MDSFIYALVLVPAMRELLPKSGIPATVANVGFYGGLLFALFLVGWGLAFIWGPVADRYGRVRTLAFTILCYSLFTFLAAFGQNIWEVAICRLLAGVGIGGEWAMGGTFVAEEWPEDRRKMGAGYMHTGYYFGFFLAALANHFIGENHGWRPMFMIGGAPAILIGLILYSVREPERWKARAKRVASPFVTIFKPEYRWRTLLNSAYVLISIIGLWAGTVYVPTGVNEIAGRMHLATVDCREARSAPDVGSVFRHHGYFDQRQFRFGFLPGSERNDLVFRRHVLPRNRRRELRHVHPLAAGTISDHVPRQRLRVCHFRRPVCGRGLFLHGGSGRLALSYDWYPRGPHGNSFHPWAIPPPVWKGDNRPAPAGLDWRFLTGT
jgi:MFS transporter